MISGSPVTPFTPCDTVVPVPSRKVKLPVVPSAGPYEPPLPALIFVFVSVSRASIFTMLPVIETVAAPDDEKLIAPDCADPPGALIVVIVLLSTTCPLKVRVSEDLSKNKDTAFDPLGTDDGVPTPSVTSTSTLAPKLPPEVNLSNFWAALVPSCAERT